MAATLGNFSADEVGFVQTMPTNVLVAVAAGELDLNRLALDELACRSMSRQGRWGGFGATFVPLAPEAILDVESLYRQHELLLASQRSPMSSDIATHDEAKNSSPLEG
jgi:hypothetical protein